MSTLIGGIGTSHAPSIAHAYDAGGRADPQWAPVFDGYVPVQNWVHEQKPDVMVLVYNDHLNRFRFDTYPTFAFGVGDVHPVADEGRGPRDLPAVPGDPDFAWRLANGLVERDFDLTICQEMTLDHGAMSVLPLVCGLPWQVRVIPIAVNVIQYPLPSPRRCFDLGRAIASTIAADSGNERVVVMASGGLSHQLHGPDFGFTNPEWDNRFMDLIETQPEALAQATHADFAQRGGAESVEMMLWLTMSGALVESGRHARRIHRHYKAPGLTGYGALVLQLED